MPSRKLVAGAVLLAVAALAITFFLKKPENKNILRASGTIEATDVDVSFQLAGHVDEVVVAEGQAVHAGDLLARLTADELVERVKQLQASLDSVTSQARQQETMIELRRSVVESQISQARSQAEASRQAAQRIREGARPQEIRVAESELAQAESTLAQRRSDFERARGLFKEGIVAKQQMDAAETALRTAESTRDAANQRLALIREGARHEDIAEAAARAEAAQAGVGLAETGLRDVDIQKEALQAAKARERELRAQLDTARTQLGHAEIHSPLNGVVLTKNVESGEVVSPGTPVVTVANIDDLWMNVYIPETQTGLVKLGQQVKVSVDSFPDEVFNGKVTFVSSRSEFTPKTILTREERIKLVFRVKVSLENTQQRLKPGMPADAEIVLSGSPGD